MHLHDLTLCEAVRLLRSGELGALEYADALLERARAHAFLNAFIWLEPDRVRATARAADRARLRGEADGLLHGVPVALKDNLDTAGIPTTGGTPGLRGNVPRRNAHVVQRLVDAGAIVFGKANLHELAFGVTTDNGAFGPSRNPYDPARIPGGSSGGTGTAVAARLVPAGIGTDTGGSIRIPAALCGLVGLRPTLSTWSQQGVVPISWTRDTPGPIARSVEDCALLHGVVTGAPLDVLPRDLRGLRLGVPRAHFWSDLHPEVAAAGERALAAVRQAGAVLVEANFPPSVPLDAAAGGKISLFEAVPALSAYLRDRALDIDFDTLVEQCASPDVHALLRGLARSRAVPREEYVVAVRDRRHALQDAYRRFFTDHRVAAIVFPTTPLPATLIGENDTVLLRGRRVPTFPTFVRNCAPASVAGIPALSLPMGLTGDGLPLGLEIDAPHGHDLDLLAIGAAIAAVLPVRPSPPAQPSPFPGEGAT